MPRAKGNETGGLDRQVEPERTPTPASPRQASTWVQQALLEDDTISALELVVTAAPALLDTGGAVIQVVEAGARRTITSAAAPFAAGLERCGPPRRRPSVQVARTGEEVQVSFPDERRPDLSEAGAAAGVRSVWSLPLRVGETVFGALTIYTASPGPWTEPGAGRRAAQQAESIVASAATRLRLEQMNGHLWRAMETRTTIGQAQGMLMATEGVSAEQAFDVLIRTSQDRHCKLREVAADIVARRSSPLPVADTVSGEAARAS